MKAKRTKRPLRAKIYDKDFKYTPSVATDIMATWKKFGFVPPSLQKGNK